MTRRQEPVGVDGGLVTFIKLEGREWYRPPLAQRARLRLVREDREEPGLDRGACLEAANTPDHRQPGFLDDFFGDGSVLDERDRQP